MKRNAGPRRSGSGRRRGARAHRRQSGGPAGWVPAARAPDRQAGGDLEKYTGSPATNRNFAEFEEGNEKFGGGETIFFFKETEEG